MECKRDGITDAEFKSAIEQAFRYAHYINAAYVVVVAGNTIERFDRKGFQSGERKDNIIGDIPTQYGRPPKYKYYKQAGRDLKMVSREELIKALEKCHNTVWQGGKLAPTTAFDEVSKLLFCKLKDEKSTPKDKAYQFQIGTNETPREVGKRIDAIYQKTKREDEEVFKEDIKLQPEVVFSTIKHLQELAINNIDLDTKGIAFERFMQDFFKGRMGQFFTPRQVVQFAVELIQAHSDMRVLDPACGSGGFLLHAMDSVRHYAEANFSGQVEIYKHWHEFAKDRLFGIEINDQIARVCKMNMIIHDDGHTNIISADALADFSQIQQTNNKFKKGYFDLILTNPPFGATVKRSEKEYLTQFELGKDGNRDRKTQKTEILFIERCIFCSNHITRIECKKNLLNPFYLSIVLNLYQRMKVFFYICTNWNNQSGVNVELLKNIKIPLPPKEVQAQITALMDRAYAIKREREAEANRLLGSMWNYVLEELEIHYAPVTNKKCFAVYLEQIQGKRIDPKKYTEAPTGILNAIKHSKYNLYKLDDLIIKSFSGEWGLDPTKGQGEDTLLVKVLRNTNFENQLNISYDNVAKRLIKRNKLSAVVLRKGDILVEKSGGSPTQPVGRVALFNEEGTYTFSNFIRCFRVNEAICKPKFLFCYLKSIYSLNLMEYLQNQTTGIRNLIMEEYLDVLVPLPPLAVQNQIAESVQSRMNQAQCLKKEAVKALAEAKEQVDRILFA